MRSGAARTSTPVSAPIPTSENWAAAALLAGPLPGGAAQHTAAVPYESGEIYFALKWSACGDISAVSNNARWPRREVYVPLVVRRADFGG